MELSNLNNKSSAAETVGSADDLLLEIFPRLPLKSLVRFESVSKQWHSLITNPNFGPLVISRSPTPSGIVFFLRNLNIWSTNSLSYEYLPVSLQQSKPININPSLETIQNGYRIMASCNGLLLCHKLKSVDYSVCNLTTNQFFTLPRLGDGEYNMHLAFDPAMSPYYKVVCNEEVTNRKINHDVIQFHIYSSETRLWRPSGDPLTLQKRLYDYGFLPVVYWNGSMHWANIDSGEHYYFNIEAEIFVKAMPKLPMEMRTGAQHYFDESCGHLHFAQIILDMQFNVYELKKDYSEWFIKHHVDLSTVLPPLPSDCTAWYSQNLRLSAVICGSEDDDDNTDSFLILDTKKRVIRYNLSDKTSETLDEMDKRDRLQLEAFQYFESISSV